MAPVNAVANATNAQIRLSAAVGEEAADDTGQHRRVPQPFLNPLPSCHVPASPPARASPVAQLDRGDERLGVRRAVFGPEIAVALANPRHPVQGDIVARP